MSQDTEIDEGKQATRAKEDIKSTLPTKTMSFSETTLSERTQNVKKRLPVFSKTEVEQHNSPESLWVVYNGKVYDITAFAEDHPGGFDMIYMHAGQDVSEVMESDEHMHSDSAYDILEDHLIGTLDSHELKSDDAQRVAHTRMDKNFLDFSKPTVWQLLSSDYSKEYYLEQVHIPRHLTFDARFFKYDIMELLTLTPWQLVPTFWLPVVAYSVYMAHQTGLALIMTTLVVPLGLMAWTVLEYVFHRFIFHMEWLLPDHPIALTLHYLLHGVHHVIPMDRYRLAMPPALFLLIHLPPRFLLFTIFPEPIAYALYAGAVLGYVCYDMTHYFCHHASPNDGYLKEVKRYHMAHHYKDANLGFGVSSKLWDVVFGTKLWVN